MYCWDGRVVKASDLNYQPYHLVFHRVGSNPALSGFLISASCICKENSLFLVVGLLSAWGWPRDLRFLFRLSLDLSPQRNLVIKIMGYRKPSTITLFYSLEAGRSYVSGLQSEPESES